MLRSTGVASGGIVVEVRAESGNADQGSGRSDQTGLRGDIGRLFSERGTSGGRPSIGRALERVATRPGPTAIVLYRASHQLWKRGYPTLAELVWRLNLLVSGADIHPGAEIGGGLRFTHTSGVVVGRGVRIGSNVTMFHGVTLGGSAKGWFDPTYEDGYPTLGDDTEIMAGAMILGVRFALTSCTTSSSDDVMTTMKVNMEAENAPSRTLLPSIVKSRHRQCSRSSIPRNPRTSNTAATSAHVGMIQKLERKNSRRR